MSSLRHKPRFTIINKRKAMEYAGLQKAKTSSLFWSVMYSHVFSYTKPFYHIPVEFAPHKIYQTKNLK